MIILVKTIKVFLEDAIHEDIRSVKDEHAMTWEDVLVDWRRMKRGEATS